MEQQQDAGLDRLLAKYRISIDAGEDAVADMVRAARLRAIRISQDIEETGLMAAILTAFGIRHPGRAAWSALAGLSIALVMGVSLGVTGIIPDLDEHAFTVDFDTVMGAGAMSSGNEAAL